MVRKHQLTDADQRHGPLKVWEVESLVLDMTPPIASLFSLYY